MESREERYVKREARKSGFVYRPQAKEKKKKRGKNFTEECNNEVKSHAPLSLDKRASLESQAPLSSDKTKTLENKALLSSEEDTSLESKASLSEEGNTALDNKAPLQSDKNTALFKRRLKRKKEDKNVGIEVKKARKTKTVDKDNGSDEKKKINVKKEETKNGMAVYKISKSGAQINKDIKSENVKDNKKKTAAKKNRSNVKKKKEDKMKIESDEDIKNVEKMKRNVSHDCAMFVGAHVSAQGGVHNAVTEAVEMGAASFALFLRNQRQWISKPLEEDAIVKFRAACTEHGFPPNMILPHASYLMNLGSADSEKLQKSRDLLVDELHRCEKLGLTLYNFHPGSTCGETSIENCLNTIAESINIGHSKSKYVITVLENMSCQGNTIGGRFEELRGIIDKVKDKSRVGICLDTCHAFAAGFDLASEEGFKQFVQSFEEIVGFQYLKALHMNDSLDIRGSHRDRHENIGKGKIGLKGFNFVMNEPRFKNIPLILETPGGVGYDREIRLLHSLCKSHVKKE